MEHLLEVCVDSVESAIAAQEGGADRLELCGHLLIGGVTPSPALAEAVLSAVKIPVNIMIRPRFGDFCFTEAEKETLLREVELFRDIGANGLVLGALLPDGRLDREHLAACMERGGVGLKYTLHRAFDLCRDPFEALDTALALGFDTLLSSGQKAKATEGIELLRAMVKYVGSRMAVMAGSGVSAKNMEELARAGIRNFHFSAKQDKSCPMIFRRPGVPMGLPLADEYTRSYADRETVAEAKAVLKSLNL